MVDLEDCNPQLARGLKMLLEFDGDVEEVMLVYLSDNSGMCAAAGGGACRWCLG